MLVGRLVHRLLQTRGLTRPGEGDESADAERSVESALRERARAMLSRLEAGETADPGAVVDQALAIWASLRWRPDVEGLFAGAAVHFEVPFSMRDPGSSRIVRGTIDCLVVREGHATVVEFKTGSRQPMHGRQLATYVEAARQLFPSAVVDGVLIYG